MISNYPSTPTDLGCPQKAMMRAALCMLAALVQTAEGAEFEIQSGMPLATQYAESAVAVTIVTDTTEQQCALRSQPTLCHISLPEEFLLMDVEVKLTHSVSDVYGALGLTLEPFRFTIAPDDDDSVITIRLTPTSARHNNREVLELAAIPVPKGAALQDHFQRARAAWVAQSQGPNAGASAYRIKAAFLVLQAASRLVIDIPSINVDADLEIRSAQEFIDTLPDSKLDEALGRGNSKNARSAAKDVFLARAKPLERAWRYVLTQSADRRLALLEAFEGHYRKTIPEGSNGQEIVERLGITLPVVWMAQGQALAESIACGHMDRPTFNSRADVVLDKIGSRILREAPVNVLTSVAEVCASRERATSASSTTLLNALCPRFLELTRLRLAQRIDAQCPATPFSMQGTDATAE